MGPLYGWTYTDASLEPLRCKHNIASMAVSSLRSRQSDSGSTGIDNLETSATGETLGIDGWRNGEDIKPILDTGVLHISRAREDRAIISVWDGPILRP